MANIIRHGKTPKWGVTYKIDGLIVDSYSSSTEIKDYEQTDENGAVCGYLVYDQTKNFDFSATLLTTDENLTCDMAIGDLVANIPFSHDKYHNTAIN